MDPKYLKSIPDMENMVKSLCDKERIRKVYLSTTKLTSEQLKRWTNDMNRDGESFEIIPEQEPREFSEMKLRIKLVVTEFVHSDREKTLRRVLSPIISSIPTLRSEFGMFHTALIVGPWYLEWTDSSLCIPKKICSSMALISADIDSIIMTKAGLEEVADKIAEVIVRWNVNNVYVNARVAGKRENEGNCQDFIDDILDCLELKPQFSGALGNFLESMRVSGKCRIEFTPDTDFRETFGLTEKKYTFDTHAELDSFVLALLAKRPTFRLDYPGEFSLLKSFDRAFWLRYFKSSRNKRYRPIGGASIDKTLCPFQHPYHTRSMM